MRFLAFQYQTACLLEDLVLLLHYRSSLILTPAILFREGFFVVFFTFSMSEKNVHFLKFAVQELAWHSVRQAA